MNNSATADDSAVRRDNFLVIAGAGLVLGMLFVSIGEFMPVWVLSKLQLPAWSEFPGGGKQTLESSVLVMAALVSIPAARYTERVGAARAMAFGLAGTVLSLAFSFVVPDAVAVLIAVLASGGFMALTTVAVLPFTAGHLKTASVPLGTGLLFTAVALPDAVVKIVLGWLG